MDVRSPERLSWSDDDRRGGGVRFSRGSDAAGARVDATQWAGVVLSTAGGACAALETVLVDDTALPSFMGHAEAAIGWKMSDEPLIEAARAARERAHAPYSKFKVGAAIENDAGTIFTGCNIENATYGLAMCAERVAIFKAISEGAGKLIRVAVVADTDSLTPPCGACRQLLWEFCSEAEIILANLHGKIERLSAEELYPRPFDASFL